MPLDLHGETIGFLSNSKLIPFPLRYGYHLVTTLVLSAFFLLSIPHASNAHVLKTCGFDSIYQLVIRHQTRKSIRKLLHLCQLSFVRAESGTPSTLVDALMDADN
ncbi:hypothetical protein POTOM_018456 [Populus tomentosa]|uniref:Uncharacterized protein n=1 Tax=Populus tomentosa TaxID=118781 RepID=A0A8X7ZVI0_POPTO|nr:hypothetical protein POTOM_018456 [Populus tomentosa]